MGARTVRFGLLAQDQVVDALNRYFVPVEFDATSGFPASLPSGFDRLSKMWDTNPWHRVSYGAWYVLDPEAQYPLCISSGPCAHERKPGDLARTFQRKVERSLERIRRIRSHTRESAAELAEVQRVAEEVANECDASCGSDVDMFTQHTIEIFARGRAALFRRRASNTFSYPNPIVRRQAADALARYASRRFDQLQSSDVLGYLIEEMTRLLADEHPDVRKSAAIALHRFRGQELPSNEDEYIAAAQRLANNVGAFD